MLGGVWGVRGFRVFLVKGLEVSGMGMGLSSSGFRGLGCVLMGFGVMGLARLAVLRQ